MPWLNSIPSAPLPFAVPSVRFARVTNWEPGYKWGPRRLYDHEIIYVISGSIHLDFNGQQLEVLPENVLLLPPRVPHLFRAGTSQERQEHIGIHFDWQPRPDYARVPLFLGTGEPAEEDLFRETQFIPGWDSQAVPMMDLRGRPRVRELLREVMAAFARSDEYANWHAGTLLAAAIGQLSHEVNLLRDVTNNPHLGADAVRRVQHARELLETLHPSPLTVAEVAARVGWSPDHLGRICREVLGTAPYRIQTAARLQRAKELLRQNTMSVTDIAHNCGYKDASHFMFTFKRETGLTAGQFAQRENRPESPPA